MADILNIVNTIRANASTEYQTRVPEATRTNIDAVGNPILAYVSMQNEYLSALVNKIAMTIVISKTFKNPLAILKKGDKPLGMDIENVHVNPAKDKGYDPSGSTLLATTDPEVFTEYFRMNRQGQYEVTIKRKQLAHAFTSWDNMQGLIDMIINTLYSGDFIDEFILMKNTFSQGVLDQKMITVGVTPLTDEAKSKAFIKAIKTASSAISYPSTAYNAFKKYNPTAAKEVQTWTDKERQILIIRSDVMNALDVDVLAMAFNLDKVKFMPMVLEVDNFGVADNVLAILTDTSIMQVYDEVNEMTEFYNPKGMHTTFYWNHWQTYGLSVLTNAIAFVDDTVAPATPTDLGMNIDNKTGVAFGEMGAMFSVKFKGKTYKFKITEEEENFFTVDDNPVLGDVATYWQVDKAGNKSAVSTYTVIN